MKFSGEKGWQFPPRLAVFWLLFFGLWRVFFIKVNRPPAGAGDAWASLRAALPLDLSAAGYAMALPVVFWAIALFFEKNWLKNGAFWFTRAIIGLFTVVCAANVFLYKEWSTVVNRRAVGYLKTPAALFDSVGQWEVFGGLALLVFGWAFCGRVFDRLVVRHGFFCPAADGFSKKGTGWVRATGGLAAVATVFLMLRGGAGQMAINESAVYFSGNSFSNHAAVNPVWHLGHDLVEERAERNPFVFFEKKEAERMVAGLFADHAPAPHPPKGGLLDSVQAPGRLVFGETNVVVLILESHAARVLDDTFCSPNLRRLAREGASFTDIYGSGFRTEQGLAAIFSGYPAQPDQSIVLLGDKAERLPELPRFFAENNYSTLFCYGGELMFANIGAYLRGQGFQKIISEKDFPAADRTQKWGADDDRMLDRFGAEIDGLRPPFFAAALTLSLHPPFDLPGDEEISGLSREGQFRRAARFADAAVGRFFEENRGKAWFENTLFVITADHGGPLPGGLPLEKGESRRVPLIFFKEKNGPAVPPGLLGQPGCQHDLAASVIGLFGAQPVGFQWSSDVFSQKKAAFGYWSNEHALGWKDAAGEHVFDFAQKRWTTGGEAPAALAYLQLLYEDFLAR